MLDTPVLPWSEKLQALYPRLYMPEGRMAIVADINDERARQDAKFGAQRKLSDLLWNTILAEEVGEAAHAVLERDFENLREELIQVAAVAVCWLEALDARDGTQAGKVL